MTIREAVLRALAWFLGIVGALLVVWFSHYLEVAKRRRQILKAIEKELGDVRRRVRDWEQKQQWTKGGPHVSEALWISSHMPTDVAELSRGIGRALEDVDNRLRRIGQLRDALNVGAPALAAGSPSQLELNEELKQWANYATHSIQAAEKTVHSELLIGQRPLWRILLRKPRAPEKPSGYDPE